MNPHILLLISLAVYFILIVILDLKFDLLRDTSIASKKPYSLAKVQLVWWMGFVLSAFIAVVFDKTNPANFIPVFSNGILVILGISTGTAVTSKLIDVSDKSNPQVTSMIQDQKSENFFLDMLSDNNGISISRLQALLFNIIFAVWFFLKVWKNLDCFDAAAVLIKPAMDNCTVVPPDLISKIIPDFDSNTLILLGLSSGTYAALKTTENKNASSAAG